MDVYLLSPQSVHHLHHLDSAEISAVRKALRGFVIGPFLRSRNALRIAAQ